MEGILVPRGTRYWYTKSSEENMVRLRTTAVAQNSEHTTLRFSEQLQPAAPVRVRAGQFFGDRSLTTR